MFCVSAILINLFQLLIAPQVASCSRKTSSLGALLVTFVSLPQCHTYSLGAACVCAVFLPQRRAVIGFEALPDYQSISFRQQECVTMNTVQALIRHLLCKTNDARLISRKRPGILKKFQFFGSKQIRTQDKTCLEARIHR